ncbi:50S ribosomal protein bL37 [Micromonospora sp. RTP1Z1]
MTSTRRHSMAKKSRKKKARKKNAANHGKRPNS